MTTDGQWKLTSESVLSVQEVVRLLSSLRRDEGGGDVRQSLDEVVINALLFSGMRNSEFCGLELRDVRSESDGDVFVVRRAERVSRVVHVPARVGRMVARYVDRVRPGLLPDGVAADDESQPLLFNEHRRPYERNGLYRRVVRILTQHGFGEKASVRLLRHSYGYLAYLQTGGNLLFVQRQLGHAHPRVTAVYAKLVDESYPKLADRVGELADLAPWPSAEITVPKRVEFDCEID